MVLPCCARPQTVDEYPAPFALAQLDSALYKRIRWWEEEQGSPLYQYGHSTADGTKLGGWPHWKQDPEIPRCSCGEPMQHLLTISQTEFDGGTADFWGPEDGRAVFERPYAERVALQAPLFADLPRMGKLYVFACHTCEGTPIQTIYQT